MEKFHPQTARHPFAQRCLSAVPTSPTTAPVSPPDKPGTSDLYCLIYISIPRKPEPTKAELLGILAKARSKNLKAGITGMLLYKKGLYLQVSEGPKHLIRKLYNTLLLDPRHNYLAVVEDGEISKRSFADWTMAFAEALDTGLLKIPGFSNYMNDPESSQFSLSDSRSLWHLLKVYREQMR
ncbi:MAG: BLUF domain-containing protein [Opitutales bacterium]|nr:BLUF domain-containing protein [Opitutales bacterium]